MDPLFASNSDKNAHQDRLRMMRTLFKWIADYELSVEDTFGSQYRTDSLSRIPDPKLCLICNMAKAWHHVGDRIISNLSNDGSSTFLSSFCRQA